MLKYSIEEIVGQNVYSFIRVSPIYLKDPNMSNIQCLDLKFGSDSSMF